VFLAVPMLPGCISINYSRECWFEPFDETALEELRPDQTDLTTCLARLGAPHFVWPHARDGFALAYARLDQSQWGVELSYAITGGASIDFSYDNASKDIEGVVLLFDADLLLRTIRRGYLRELPEAGSKRPSS
jgi:hypothetical protein